MSKGCPGKLKLSEYFDDVLDPNERILIQKHILKCSECRKIIESFRVIRNVFYSEKEKVAPLEFLENLNKRLEFEKKNAGNNDKSGAGIPVVFGFLEMYNTLRVGLTKYRFQFGYGISIIFIIVFTVLFILPEKNKIRILTSVKSKLFQKRGITSESTLVNGSMDNARVIVDPNFFRTIGTTDKWKTGRGNSTIRMKPEVYKRYKDFSKEVRSRKGVIIYLNYGTEVLTYDLDLSVPRINSSVIKEIIEKNEGTFLIGEKQMVGRILDSNPDKSSVPADSILLTILLR